jgi:hypothetical protein
MGLGSFGKTALSGSDGLWPMVEREVSRGEESWLTAGGRQDWPPPIR